MIDLKKQRESRLKELGRVGRAELLEMVLTFEAQIRQGNAHLAGLMCGECDACREDEETSEDARAAEPR